MPSVPLAAARVLRALPEQVALGRAALGMALLARPSLLPTALGVSPQDAARLGWVVQMLGAREVALGLGSAAAGRTRGTGARPWLLAGLFCDAVDAVAVAGALGRGRVERGPATAVLTAAVTAVAVQAGELARRG